MIDRKINYGGGMDLYKFLGSSYTAFQAVQNAEAYLNNKGFIKLDRQSVWDVKLGGKYYLSINDSAFIAVSIGDPLKGIKIACAHTDSPCLRVKGSKLLDSVEGKRINVETYGGLILYSMMDIPLKIAGRALVRTDCGVEKKFVVSDYNVNIPSLCIHHNRDVNSGFSPDVQFDMAPLFGSDDLYGSLGLSDVLDADLFVVPDISATNLGVDGKLFSSPRIDNLTSVYACLDALVSTEPQGVCVCACFDNEEIGSGTKQGAGSVILRETLERIWTCLGYDSQIFVTALEKGLVLSVDNAHAAHQSSPQKSDPVNSVVLGGGVVIKHHVNYCTDSVSSALFKAVLDRKKINYQDYYNHSDIRCGSTLGLITSRQFAMRSLDIGIAQLAMHSAVETADIGDVDSLKQAVKAVYDTIFLPNGNGFVIVQ